MIALTAGVLIVAASMLGGEQCEDARTTVEMRECLTREFTQTEQRLDAVWSSLASTVSGRQRVLLDRASTAWRLYRDLQCEAEAAEVEGGTLAPVAELQCRLRLTEQRVTNLETVSRDRGPL